MKNHTSRMCTLLVSFAVSFLLAQYSIVAIAQDEFGATSNFEFERSDSSRYRFQAEKVSETPPSTDAQLAGDVVPPPLSGSVSDTYVLGSGDSLKVTVFNEEDLSGEFKIDGSGMLALPLVGSVKVGGLPLDKAERAIEAAFSDGYLIEPRVNLEVLNFRPFYILGEVNKPGNYPYVEGMKALNAVAMAGGYTYRGKTEHLFITRAADSAKKKTEVSPDTVIFPGDVIEVPERFF